MLDGFHTQKGHAQRKGSLCLLPPFPQLQFNFSRPAKGVFEISRRVVCVCVFLFCFFLGGVLSVRCVFGLFGGGSVPWGVC